MPYNQVKSILLKKFHHRLETGLPVTVLGRTLDTVTKVYPPPGRDKKSTVGKKINFRTPSGQLESETK